MKLKAYFAEFFGTFALVLIGCGVAISTYIPSQGILTVALAFGLTVSVMIYAVGGISGGHFNPAVSFAFALSHRIRWKDFGMYVLFQLLGSLLASILLVGFFNTTNLAANEVLIFRNNNIAFEYLIAILVEIVVTFIFVFVILTVTSKPDNKHAGLIIGVTLTLMILLSGSLTNASLNPARSLFPALFQGGNALNEVWIFIVGPLLGSMLSTMVYYVFYGIKDNKLVA